MPKLVVLRPSLYEWGKFLSSINSFSILDGFFSDPALPLLLAELDRY